MKKKIYKTTGVCAREITFNFEDNKIYNLEFSNGCNGNLKAISKLVEGKNLEDVMLLLKGNTCGARPTSCTDQLALAISEVL